MIGWQAMVSMWSLAARLSTDEIRFFRQYLSLYKITVWEYFP